MFVSDKEMQYPGNESSTTLECSVSPEGVTPQIFGFGGVGGGKEGTPSTYGCQARLWVIKK